MKTYARLYVSIAAVFFVTFAAVATADSAPKYGPSEHDRVTPTSSEALAALEVVRRLGGKDLQSGADAITPSKT
jgi:hypothetical protein